LIEQDETVSVVDEPKADTEACILKINEP